MFSPAVAVSSTVPQLAISTVIGPGTPEVGVAFVLPESGKVLITIGMSVTAGAAGCAVLDTEFWRGTKADTTILPLLDTGGFTRRMIVQGGAVAGQSQESSRTFIVDVGGRLRGSGDLVVPGEPFYVRTMQQAFGAGGPINIYGRSLSVVPLVV